MTSTVVNLEGDLERVRADKITLQEDLQSVRDLNAKLDSGKEHIARQLSARNVENEQVGYVTKKVCISNTDEYFTLLFREK